MNQASAFAKRLLTEGAIAYFCTTDPRNNPHVVPVRFLFDPTQCQAYFLFSKDSKKLRNLRLRPELSFTVDVRDHVNPLENKGVMIQGEATMRRPKDHDVDMENVEELFEEKYGWAPPGNYFQSNDDQCLVSVIVKKISCWQGSTFVACPKFCVAASREGCVRRSIKECRTINRLVEKPSQICEYAPEQ